MNLQIGYSNSIVTSDEMNLGFEPCLTFSIKHKPSYGWYQLIRDADSESRDVALHGKIFAGICHSVSDGDTTHPVSSEVDALKFHQELANAIPEMADELFCEIALELAGRYLAIAREKATALKKTSPQSNGSKPKKALAKQ